MRTIILHLSLIDSIGPSAVERIMSSIGIDNLDQLYSFSESDFMYRCGLSAKQAAKIVPGLSDARVLEQELELIDTHKISWAYSKDDHYPELLKTIHIPPTVLYWQGTLPGQQAIAIVGSRDANAYGRMAIDQLVPPLVQHGWAIVSGGARGADTMAHRKALDEGGVTVAVLGSGLLCPYPSENKGLFQEILAEGGAVVSNFPLGMRPLPDNFPARNRVIAGMSRGCIVIQAAAKSGARITADFCLSQGREVFAVPGPIDDLLSAGCHELISQGAKLTTNASQVLIEFGFDISQPEMLKKVKNNQIHPEEHLKGASRRVTPAFYAEPVDPVEAAIITACTGPCSVDELMEATGLPLIQMSKVLFDLQIKGKLTQNMAGLWEKQ